MKWFTQKPSKKAKELLARKRQANENTTRNAYDISNCELNKLPSDTFFNIDLYLKTAFDCSHNKLLSLDDGGSYADCHRLEKLDISFNKIESLKFVGQLTNLKILNVSRNEVKSLPDEISALINLQVLNVSDNDISSLPKDIGSCKYLQMLDVRKNYKLSVLPNSLGAIGVTLENLLLDHENFSTPPTAYFDSNSTTQYKALKFLATAGGYEFPTVPLQSKASISTTKKTTFSPVPDSSIDELLRQNDLEKEQNARILLESLNASDRKAEQLAAQAHKETELNASLILTKLSLDDADQRKRIIKLAKVRETELKHALTELEKSEREANLLIQTLLENEEKKLPSILDSIRESEFVNTPVNEFDFNLLLKQEFEENQNLSLLIQMQQTERNDMQKKVLAQISNENAYISNFAKEHSKITNLSTSELLKRIENDDFMQRKLILTALSERDAQLANLNANIAQIERQLVRITQIEHNEREIQLQKLANKERRDLANLLEAYNDEMLHREKEITNLVYKLEEDYKNERFDYWISRYNEILKEKPVELDQLVEKVGTDVKMVLETAEADHQVIKFARHAVFTKDDLARIDKRKLTSMGIHDINEQNKILEAIGKYNFMQCTRKKELEFFYFRFCAKYTRGYVQIF